MRRVFFKIMLNSQDNTCFGIPFSTKLQAWPAQQPYNIKNETPTQGFSCEFYEIFKNTSSSTEHLIIL